MCCAAGLVLTTSPSAKTCRAVTAIRTMAEVFRIVHNVVVRALIVSTPWNLESYQGITPGFPPRPLTTDSQEKKASSCLTAFLPGRMSCRRKARLYNDCANRPAEDHHALARRPIPSEITSTARTMSASEVILPVVNLKVPLAHSSGTFIAWSTCEISTVSE
jgi:hypothetical protein